MFARRLLGGVFRATNGHRLNGHQIVLMQKPFALNAFGSNATTTRWRHSARMNTVIVFVPQQEAWIVERMGRFNKILDPGLNLLAPIIDRVSYVQSLKEMAIDIPQQAAVTADNVTLAIDGVLYLRVVDPYRASYGVEDPEFAITQLAQTTMRSEIGKITLDSVFKERESLNIGIVEAINVASNSWGLTCMRYEIRDIKLPNRVQEAMQMQVEAERKKRAAVLESEGMREADINIAEGKKRARILASEALKIEQINSAQGEANAMLTKAEAKAKSLNLVGDVLRSAHGGNAASLNVAEQYVKAFSELARTNNTLILSNDAGDVVKMTSQALQVYKSLSTHKHETPAENVFDEQQNFVDENTSQINTKHDKPEYYSDGEDDHKTKS